MLSIDALFTPVGHIYIEPISSSEQVKIHDNINHDYFCKYFYSKAIIVRFSL